MARTVPATSYQSPGGLVSCEVWNKGPKALNDFLSNRPAMVAQTDYAQAVATDTWVTVFFALNLLDTDGGHHTAVNNQMFIAQVTGWYWVRASVSWNTTGAGNGAARMDTVLAKNGITVPGSAQFLYKGANVNSAQQASALVQLNPGDRVELWARQHTGVTIDTDFGFGIEGGMSVLWVHA